MMISPESFSGNCFRENFSRHCRSVMDVTDESTTQLLKLYRTMIGVARSPVSS